MIGRQIDRADDGLTPEVGEVQTATHVPTLPPCVLQVTGLTPEAEEAQEYLMKLPTRFNKLAQRQAKSLAKKAREPKEWAWINGRVI
tara:strand:- start:138 stop:398 length:261 start_codon:yes stop_codon:yes gene_type:complete